MQTKRFNLCVHFKNTPETNCPGYQGYAYLVELVGVPGPNSGSGCRVRGPKSADFLLHMLKNAESNVELKSLVIGHIQANKGPKMWCRIYRAHGCINLYHELCLTHGEDPTEKEQIVHKPKRRLYRSKRYPRRNLRNKTLGRGSKFLIR